MVRMIKVPFGGKNSMPRILGKQSVKSLVHSNKYAVPAEYNTTPSVVSTNSDSSGAGHEVAMQVDWTTATSVVVPPQVEQQPQAAVPIKKKRTRSFRDRVFRGRRSFSLKADNRHDFSLIESPIQSPTPTELPMDADTVVSHDTPSTTFGDDSQEAIVAANTATLNVRSRSLKRLAPPKPDSQYSLLDDDESSAFVHNDPYLSTEENRDATVSDDEEEETAASEKDAQSAFSIPLSYFLKKKSSWGVSVKTETSQSEQDSRKFVVEERHWGRRIAHIRSRDRSTPSWVPTDEERYKISQGFVSGDDDVHEGDEESSGASSCYTGSFSTASGLSTFVTGTTGATGETGETEETNDTTSAFTGHYTGDSRDDSISSSNESISTNQSVVTGTTGDTSMFSLGVDESASEYSTVEPPRRERGRGQRRGRSPPKRRQRRTIKSEKNLLVEVFSDLRLLVEDMADAENGLRPGCFTCA